MNWLNNIPIESRKWYDKYRIHFIKDVLPKMKQSNYFVAICPNKLDIKFATELGFAIMLNKPIIIPNKLIDIADRIIYTEDQMKKFLEESDIEHG